MTRSLRSSADISPKGEDLENHRSQALFAECAFSLRCMFFFFYCCTTTGVYLFELHIYTVYMFSFKKCDHAKYFQHCILLDNSSCDLALNVLVQAWTSYGPGPHVAP